MKLLVIISILFILYYLVLCPSLILIHFIYHYGLPLVINTTKRFILTFMKTTKKMAISIINIPEKIRIRREIKRMAQNNYTSVNKDGTINMDNIDFDDVEMQLQQPYYDSNGQFIIPEDKKNNDDKIKMYKNWANTIIEEEYGL